MNTVPNFTSSLLDESPDHVDRPKPLPTGSYLCVVGEMTEGKSKQKQTPFIEFTLRVVSPLEDVDPDALAEMDGAEGRSIRATYYVTPDSVFRLDEFHEHCGIDLSIPATRKQRSAAILNANVIARIRHEWPKDETGNDDLTKDPFARLDRTAPAE